MTLERNEHAAFIAWLREVAALRWPRDCIPGVGFPFVVSHSAAKRVGRGIGWAKQQGLRPGVPDFQIPIHRGEYAGLWIELKRGKGRTKVSVPQKMWNGWLNAHGFLALICYGVDEAIKETEKYMQGRSHNEKTLQPSGWCAEVHNWLHRSARLSPH